MSDIKQLHRQVEKLAKAVEAMDHRLFKDNGNQSLQSRINENTNAIKWLRKRVEDNSLDIKKHAIDIAKILGAVGVFYALMQAGILG